jgi:hypothetical protein
MQSTDTPFRFTLFARSISRLHMLRAPPVERCVRCARRLDLVQSWWAPQSKRRKVSNNATERASVSWSEAWTEHLRSAGLATDTRLNDTVRPPEDRLLSFPQS